MIASDRCGSGLEIGRRIAKLFPGQMNWDANERLVGDRNVLRQMEAGKNRR